MAQIKDILSIQLEDDINSVIDLNSDNEETLKEELDSFILTESLAKHLADFCDLYSKDLKQTGIWLSGFYGSGKSFFAKMLGLLINNRSILGTPVQDRFAPKIEGLPNSALLKNSVNKLCRTKNHIVQFDAAKESSTTNLSLMMFKAFLRSLGFLDNWYGMMEYDMWLNDRYSEFKDKVLSLSGNQWSKVRKSRQDLPKYAQEASLAMGYTEDEYLQSRKLYEDHFNTYDANKLKADLQLYLDKFADMRIVYMVDEVSESITQKRINILDLEGVAEILGKNLWMVAIAQQRLDDVINSANVSKDKLTKIIDRFKNRIDIKAEEVDTIIRRRLLAKTDQGNDTLAAYFDKHSGMIGDITNIGGASLKKTQTAQGYADYYPFFEHQFKLLQYFLFGTKNLVKTQVGTRGMLISAFDILKKESVKDHDVFTHVNAAQLRRQAEENVSESLYNRYQQALGFITPAEYKYVKGDELLQVIDFLTNAEVIQTTAENIAKAYVVNPDDYYEIKAEVKKALDKLVDEKILLFTANQYRITSETEQRIIHDMYAPEVAMHRIKSELVKVLKTQPVTRDCFFVTVDGKKIDFAVKMNNDEPISNNQSSKLQVVMHDILTASNADGYVDTVKSDTSDAKSIISIVPDTTNSEEILRLQEEIIRFADLENRNYSTQEEKDIVASILSAKPDKEARLAELIQNAYAEGSLVYCYNVSHFTDANYTQVISDTQRQLYNNIFTRRLSAQLNDSLAPQVLKKSDSQLKTLFTSPEFTFFDAMGRFIGEQLSVVTEVIALLKSFTVGSDLEDKLEGAPTGYDFGTIITTLAALFRGNKIIVKYGGEEYHSYSDPGVEKVFSNTTQFRKASFKAVAKSLTYNERQEMVDILKDDCNYKSWVTDKDEPQVSYKMNDFKIVDAIRTMSKEIISRINQQIMGDVEMERIFHKSVRAKDVLSQYVATVTESNYFSTAKQFLADSDEYIRAVELAAKDLKFIKTGWEDLKRERRFIADVEEELEKAQCPTDNLMPLKEEFEQLYSSDPVGKSAQLKQITQKVRDLYYQTMLAHAKSMTAGYDALKQKATALLAKIEAYPAGWNTALIKKVKDLISTCDRNHVEKIDLPSNSVKCGKTGFLLRDFTYAIDKLSSLNTALDIWETEIVTEDPTPKPAPNPDPDPKPKPQPKPQPVVRKMRKQLPSGKLSVVEYKHWLTNQLQQLNNFASTDSLDFEN